MDSQRLKEILDRHAKWLAGDEDGKRADLRGADLRETHLCGADLSRADLRGADLRRTDLHDADLSEADLHGADLRRADLRNTNLYKANLRGADMSEADLYGANLHGANMSWTILSGAVLRLANLSDADLPDFMICPESGSFDAWKKCADGVVLKIHIPPEAQRTNSLVGRKCRASKIEVVAAYRYGEEVTGIFENWSRTGHYYEVGKVYECEDFDDDIRVECTKGIHFFITRKEAEEW